MVGQSGCLEESQRRSITRRVLNSGKGSGGWENGEANRKASRNVVSPPAHWWASRAANKRRRGEAWSERPGLLLCCVVRPLSHEARLLSWWARLLLRAKAVPPVA